MKHWKKLLAFLLVHVMLAETGDPACSNADCYILLEEDLNTTQQKTMTIGNYLEDVNVSLTTTLQLLYETTATVNDTLLYAQQLNVSGAELLNTFTSISSGLALSQQQIYSLSDQLTSISANATFLAMTSDDAAMTVNQTRDHIIMAIYTLDQLEATVLPMLDSVATLIAEQTDNGTELYAELMMQFESVTISTDQLFNLSLRSLRIINATLESLMSSSALQNNISEGVLTQTAIIQDISDDLDRLTERLTFIKELIQFYSLYISTNTGTFSIATVDQINQELQGALQLITNANSLLGNTSLLINVRRDLYSMLASYEESYRLVPGQVDTLQEEALRLYSDSVSLNQNAMTASQEAHQLVAEAQYLQMVLQNFSGFVATASELLEGIDIIRMSAMETIDTANNISDMIMETYQVINDSLLVLMESSNLVEIIETTLNSWSVEVTDAVQTTQNLDDIKSSITLLETGQMAIENITLDFISQQEYINDTEADIETAARTVQDRTYSCINADSSVAELQSRLDNLNFLSYEDIADVSNRITLVELSIDDIQNMAAILTGKITQQRVSIGILENEIAEIMTERDTLTELYNSLPQSCDEDI